MRAHVVFYPAAAAYGALIVPASTLAMTGRASGLASLADPLGHAHEMLLGFALAVVAGNQLGRASTSAVLATLAAWGAARASFLFMPTSVLASALNAAFAALLALQVVPRLFGSAKKLRNQALPAMLTGICAAGAAWPIARFAAEGSAPASLLLATVLLFAMLLLFMGGRIIPPAIAGQLYRQGEVLDARVQPRVEGAILVAGAVAIAALLFGAARPAGAGMLAITGVLAGVRLVRWRLWAVRGRPDLFCLAAGYGWLSLGLIALAAAILADRYLSAALHLITVGALGTLTLNVMAQSWLAQARRPPATATQMISGTLLLAAATIFRLLAAVDSPRWLIPAAGCWAAAFVFLLWLFWRNRR